LTVKHTIGSIQSAAKCAALFGWIEPQHCLTGPAMNNEKSLYISIAALKVT
jgi:hypothetical protein